MPEYLNVQPSPSALVQSLRDIGYSMESAIADVIDNSITAKAKNIHVSFAWNNENPWIAVVDDGYGMSPAELTDAMRLGSRNPLEDRGDEDLGRFGLGLKTASFSQCRQLTLISRKDGTLACREWDLDQIEENPDNGWRLKVLESFEIQDDKCIEDILPLINQTGTIVLLRKLDRYDGLEKKLNSLIEHARLHLELVFHRFLSPRPGEKKINIFLNNDHLAAFNPFNPTHPATQELPEQFIHVDEQAVKVQPYVLPHYNKSSRDEYQKYACAGGYLQNQGFYVYRNRRLIIKGTWFRLIKKEELTKLIRVQVDIPNSLDHLWKIDVKKSHASPPEAIRNELKLIIDRIAASGKKVYRQKGKKLASTVKVPGWTRTAAEGKIIYEINREHPLLSQFQHDLPNKKKQAFKDLIFMLESSFPTELFYSDVAKKPENLCKPEFNEQQVSDLKLSICAWNVITAYFKSTVPDDDAVPGASIAVQTYGDFLNFNPHLHAIVSDGCFLKDGSFQTASIFMLEDLEEAFQYEVLKMLKKEGKINDTIIENMLSWHHSGFNVYIGDRIESDDKAGLGNLARYIIRACFSQERMVYVPAKKSDDGVAKVIYTSKDRKTRKVFTALDWLARLVTHIPSRYEHTVRYYGYFSNKSRGMRKKADTDNVIPTIMPNELSSNEARQNWARLIQKIYEVDPLVCPKCQGQMKIISIIDDFEIIDTILKHLNLWDIRNHDPPEIEPVYIPELTYVEDSDYDNSGSQIPTFDTFWS